MIFQSSYHIFFLILLKMLSIDMLKIKKIRIVSMDSSCLVHACLALWDNALTQ